ncbi:MAG: Gfo/Idh/MocA family oxidoreductase [Spirochaetes bacterium]|nr:Gfo/Idh/MocA family oxidoreductase [Spirochaetota bacterium]
MERVKWGVLGISGHFIKKVLLPMQKSDIVELYGVASRNLKKAQITADKFGINKVYSGYGELLDDPEIEAVYLPLPNNLHVEWIKKAADHGKHILCEKPIALNAEEAEKAVKYAGDKHVRIMEAFMYRFHPQWKRALELVRVGEIGKVNFVQCTFTYNNPDRNNIRNKPEMGGGSIYDIGCYAVSVARYIFDKEPLRVVSLIERDMEFKTDSRVAGILDFKDAHSVFSVGTRTFPYQVVEIFGTGGIIKIRIPFNTFPDVPAEVEVTTKVGMREILTEPEDQYQLEFEAFSRAVREDSDVPTAPVDAVNNLKVMDALFRSEKSRNWEDVR